VVIDDDYGARLQVELALLTSTSARVIGQARNGARGAELAERLQPDVIVLDLMMPVMDGYEALPLLRRLCPRARILVRSGNDPLEHEQRALDMGAFAFVPKFIAPDELRDIIEQAARPSHGRRYLDMVRRASHAVPAAAEPVTSISR